MEEKETMKEKDPRVTPVYVTEDPESGLDYRHRPAAPRTRYNPVEAKALADRIILLAIAQDCAYIVPENLEIEPGYRCTSCLNVEKHTRECAPPRGLRLC